MSAHDDLLAHGLTVYEAANVLEKHAHELAEKIRRCNPDRSSDWSDGVDWAADLIDPEVE